jgi:two-component system, chemotaxis family, protein-glutamate methylesterase/glutaminase
MTGPWLIALAASPGGADEVRTVLRALPDDLHASVVVYLDPLPGEKDLASILRQCTGMPVVPAARGERIVPGVVYVARPRLRLVVAADRHFEDYDGHRMPFVRCIANPLFETAARVFGRRTLAVLLTSGGCTRTADVQDVRAAGGIIIAQDTRPPERRPMADAAVQRGAVDFVLPIEHIASVVTASSTSRRW